MKLHSTTIARVRTLQADALAELEREYAPAPRPQCRACGRHAPTIDGYCVPHMHQRTEIYLHTISPEQLGL